MSDDATKVTPARLRRDAYLDIRQYVDLVQSEASAYITAHRPAA